MLQQIVAAALFCTINQFLKRILQSLPSLYVIKRLASDGSIAIAWPHNFLKSLSIKIAYALLVYGTINITGETEAIAAKPSNGTANFCTLISDQSSNIGVKLNKNFVWRVSQPRNQNFNLRTERVPSGQNVAPRSANPTSSESNEQFEEIKEILIVFCGVILGCHIYGEIAWIIDKRDRRKTYGD